MNKIKLFLRKLIRAQFLWNHIFIFIVIPLISAFVLWYFNIYIWNIEKIMPNIVTIIWVTWSLLLNFLAIILTSNSTVLSKIKVKDDDKYIYWVINLGTKKIKNPTPINFYYFIYYKTFFLIFLSVFFILLYIFSFLWFYALIWYIDNLIWLILSYFKFNLFFFANLFQYWIIKYILISWYLYLIILYFTLFLHLIYRLYYLFHNDDIL